ncbi:L-tyrosine:2-oxoglutarate aminotransferase [Lentinus tigrinus ALCF2SS1-7]|uniref:L-tyrosine:2-oxoglutarate aminotransferase n=1 Tax=Lentinus tigrinus ALCF2SS1-6 TaxID=1328759 RepID=A0A5C2RUT2_9APHY|nr:L-tyrosine:2-oxoglutarate aminotransferase [Lentinus tigrinus ALCF2SS1-6]RPD70673.1 L-tyrosine:2-oxoglutarate aminotransferase [Lentinus tigrinus ALCF2SS1-7]
MGSIAVEEPKFVDLTHHLAPEVLVRKTNPLKDIIRISLENPHLVSLANGDPHHSLYPIRRVNYEVASVADEDPVSTWRSLGASAPTETLTAPQDTLHKASLAYGHGAGLADALRTVTELNVAYHHAPHHVATMTLGNADAITKVFRILGAHGDHFLADEFTFGPMPIAAEAHGVKWVPVRIDAGGIIPEELEKVLAHWDYKRGKRPHVLYTVPCGQNPTGSTLSLERRNQIYDIAKKYDLIIVEDDPYYFLQYDPPNTEAPSTQKPFPLSFLSLDVDGRVVRIDSFSKIMAPGLRLGWITSQPAFQAHLIRYIDLSTQHPSGFPQALVTLLLEGWGLAGFDRWVRSLRLDYQRRRDFLLGLFEREVARTGLASVDVPEAGMFLWIRVHIEKHPRFRRVEHAPEEKGMRGPQTNARQLMQELFEACLKGGLVIVPATVFLLPTEEGYEEAGAVHIDDRSNFLRATFAGSEETMAAGMPILGKVLREFFADAPKKPEDAPST